MVGQERGKRATQTERKDAEVEDVKDTRHKTLKFAVSLLVGIFSYCHIFVFYRYCNTYKL